MTDEQIRIAVAEACGWTDVSHTSFEEVDIESRSVAQWAGLAGNKNRERCFLPDYLNDANTSKDFEALLSAEERNGYVFILVEGFEHPKPDNDEWDYTYREIFRALQRTPRERCIAFLKVKGLYTA